MSCRLRVIVFVSNFLCLGHASREGDLPMRLPDLEGQRYSADVSPHRYVSGHGTTYHSSPWEQLWINNIVQWQQGRICEALAEQKIQVQQFMNDTCSARTDTPWCLVDDSVRQMWYNTQDGRLMSEKPSEVRSVHAIKPVVPNNPDIWSYFEHRNSETGKITREYIEPLVSHLRHPLACCEDVLKGNKDVFKFDRSYVMPPSTGTLNRKAYLFDAGSSIWNQGAGGPSLSYFAAVWARHAIVWDRIEGWDCAGSEAAFYASVPADWKHKTVYHKQCISTSPAKTPFVPQVIRKSSAKEDYVLFKLDIDSKTVEKTIVDYLLSNSSNDLDWIDEFVWEHHVDNYLMAPDWGQSQDMTMSIADSYQYFLKLRQKGVRAHSWV